MLFVPIICMFSCSIVIALSYDAGNTHPAPSQRPSPTQRSPPLLSPFTATESLNPIYKSVSNHLFDSVGHRNWRQKSTERLKTLHDTALTLPRGGALHDPIRRLCAPKSATPVKHIRQQCIDLYVASVFTQNCGHVVFAHYTHIARIPGLVAKYPRVVPWLAARQHAVPAALQLRAHTLDSTLVA